MRHLISSMLMVVFVSFGSLYAKDISGYSTPMDYSTPNQQELDRYYAQLQNQLEVASQRLQTIKEQMADPKVMDPGMRIRFQIAVEQLEAKTELVSNFIGTQSLRSPNVREALLEVIAKDEMTQLDLIALQRLVESEKAKIKEFDRSQAQRMQEQEQQVQPKIKTE